jgi:glycosyltransferase involved in cell wall biosynthesis
MLLSLPVIVMPLKRRSRPKPKSKRINRPMKEKAHERLKMSVALCTYNGAKYLREQLDSIAEQTRLPDELVICDDCSMDNTVEVVESFRLKSSFTVRLFQNSENLGSTKNFEKAIALCTGDIIALCDQDDTWHSEKLKRFEETFSAKPNVGMVFSDLEIVDENLRPLGYRAWQSTYFSSRRRRLFSKRSALNVLLKHNVVTGCAMAFRATLRNIILPIPTLTAATEVHHDYWIALIVGAVSGVALIETPLVKYRQHSNQQLGLAPPALIDETQRVIRWLSKPLEKQPILLESIRTRLCLMDQTDSCKRYIAAIDQRQMHIQRRLQIKDSRFIQRGVFGLRELAKLHYFRYSEGWPDVVRDVIPATVVLFGLCIVRPRAGRLQGPFVTSD